MTALLGAFGAFALADWAAVATGRRALEWVAKPAALGALLAWAATGPHAGPALVLALAFSLAGDVCLMLPVDAFLPGLASFLAAHLCYVAAFAAPPGVWLFWLAAVVLASAPVARPVLGAVAEPPLRRALALYMLAVSLMVAAAIASSRAAAAAGAVLFLVSDSLIAWDRFVRRLPWAPLPIMVTYHLGQLGLVAGLR
ncbi:MAG TPA: lysoplasmalogenase [Candidatus Binatia bacterium]|nr:lysoplasmalogenase [Candidatus Binatia bacterium]